MLNPFKANFCFCAESTPRLHNLHLSPEALITTTGCAYIQIAKIVIGQLGVSMYPSGYTGTQNSSSFRSVQWSCTYPPLTSSLFSALQSFLQKSLCSSTFISFNMRHSVSVPIIRSTHTVIENGRLTQTHQRTCYNAHNIIGLLQKGYSVLQRSMNLASPWNTVHCVYYGTLLEKLYVSSWLREGKLMPGVRPGYNPAGWVVRILPSFFLPLERAAFSLPVCSEHPVLSVWLKLNNLIWGLCQANGDINVDFIWFLYGLGKLQWFPWENNKIGARL